MYLNTYRNRNAFLIAANFLLTVAILIYVYRTISYSSSWPDRVSWKAMIKDEEDSAIRRISLSNIERTVPMGFRV